MNEEKSIIFIEMLTSGDPEVLYDAIIDIGKGNYLEYQSEVENFLTHPDESVRSAAIRTLALYWRLDGFDKIAFDMYLYDKDDETRADALMCWTSYFYSTNEKNIIMSLSKILSNKNEHPMVRLTAYSSIFTVADIEPEKKPQTAKIDFDEIDEKVEWDLIKSLINRAK